MRTTLRAACARRKPDELVLWARDFVLSPARTDRDRRERVIVAQLLADVEAGR